MLRLNVLMELKLTSAGRLFQALTTLSQKKVLRIPALCGLKKFISISTRMGNRNECKNFVDININKLV